MYTTGHLPTVELENTFVSWWWEWWWWWCSDLWSHSIGHRRVLM